MSYAADVKKELTVLNVNDNNAKAELAALFRMNGITQMHNFTVNQVIVQTENAAIARRIYTLIKTVYQADIEVKIMDKSGPKKRRTYGVLLSDQIDEILTELGIDIFGLHPPVPSRLINTKLKEQSFLRGAFLAAGSVNAPESQNYHLEIFTVHENFAEELLVMMRRFQLPAKISDRQEGYIVYLKRSEKIVEFLALIGATNTMLKFEDIRMMRDMRNSANRLNNADNANIQKATNAAQDQINMIRLIEQKIGLDDLPISLQEIAHLRLDFPEESLGELGAQMAIPLSKSGVNHRMRKLKAIYQELLADK